MVTLKSCRTRHDIAIPTGQCRPLRLPLVPPGSRSHREFSLSALKKTEGISLDVELNVDDVALSIIVERDLQREEVMCEIHPRRLHVALRGETVLEGHFPSECRADLDGSWWTFNHTPENKLLVIVLGKAPNKLGIDPGFEDDWRLLLTEESAEASVRIATDEDAAGTREAVAYTASEDSGAVDDDMLRGALAEFARQGEGAAAKVGESISGALEKLWEDRWAAMKPPEPKYPVDEHMIDDARAFAAHFSDSWKERSMDAAPEATRSEDV